MKLNQVNPQYVCQLWPDVFDFLASGLPDDPEYSLDQLQMMLVRGEQTLLVAEDDGIKGAAAVSIVNHPKQRIAFISTIGGRGISTPGMFDQLKAWAKGQGCTKLRGCTDERMEQFWNKKLGFTTRYRVIEAGL